MKRLLKPVCLSLVTLGAPAYGLDLDDLLNTPRRNSCTLFTDDADYVTFYIDMNLEGGEVQMRVPKLFLEDGWDHQDNLRHGSQLFRVMIDNFLPVTRRKTAEFNKARPWDRGKHAYMHFLVGDYVDLGQMEELSLQRMVAQSPRRPASDFEAKPFEYGLKKFTPFGGEVQKDVFVSHSKGGELDTIIQCNAAGTVNYPGCNQFFRSNGLDVNMSFQLPYLSKWDQIQTDVDRFLSCATNHNHQ